MTRLSIFNWLARGVPQGQILPSWLVAVQCALFPRRSLLYWLQRDCGFDLWTGCWTINGVRFSDEFFTAMAEPRRDMVYRFERDPVSNLVTVTGIYCPPEAKP